MLGTINPQTIKIDQQAVVYPNRDHVSALTVKKFDGRKYVATDLSALTRVVLVFPSTDPTIVYDSDLQPAVFSWAGSVLTVDLSAYAMPASILPCYLIAFDAEHPNGQVLVDNNDTTLEFDFRNVLIAGTTPAPAVEFVTEAPNDGQLYGRRSLGWVPIDDVVAGVTSVNGQTGTVVLDAVDVGADPAGTGATEAAAAVAAHEAALDPHTQYTTTAEAAAAAPVQSVNGLTGAVGLDAGDVGADPIGTAASVMASHDAEMDPHTQYNTAINTAMQASMTSGLVQGNNGPYLTALTTTTLRIEATTGLYFESELGALGEAFHSFPSQDIALNTIPLVADGLYIRYVALDADGVASFEAQPINTDPTRVQLGIVFLSKTGAAVTFIHGLTGPLNVYTMPILANVSYTDRAMNGGLRARIPLSPNTNMTIAQGEGQVAGEAINWGSLTDVNTRVLAAINPMSFLLLDGGLGALGALPAAVTAVDPTQYWNGTATVAVPAAGNATVQRILVTYRGTIVIQRGEQVYSNITNAYNSVLIAPFTEIFPAGYAIEIARMALRRAGTDLQDPADARFAIFGGGGAAAGGGGGGGGGAVDSVNGEVGTVVLDAADVGADPAGTADAAVGVHEADVDPHPQYLTPTEGNAAYAPLAHVGTGGTAHANVVAAGAAGFMTGADKTKLDGIATGATQNSSDAFLLARANHTGSQTASTIGDFDSATRAQVEAELIAGTNVTITPAGSGATRTLTIAASGGGGGASLPVVQALSSTRNLVLADINTFNVNSTTNNYTATIQPQSAVTWTADAEIHFLPSNTGDIVVTAGVGVSLNGVVAGSVTLSTQNGAASIKRIAADSWWIGGAVGDFGDIVADSVRIGKSGTASNNFTWRNLLDGILRLSRGNADAPITDVMRVKADNSVEFPGGVASGVLGAGQTWQNVVGSRALGVTYTNSTNKPIQLCVLCSVTASGSNFTVTVNGVGVQAGYASLNSSMAHIQITIPAGATYSVTGTNGEISAWWELR